MKELFVNRLRKAMEIRDMKQVDLVERTGLSKSAISQYYSGIYEPKQKALYKIAKALNVNEAWLMGYDAPMEYFNFDFDSIIDSNKLSKEVKLIEAIQEVFGKDAVKLLKYFSELNELGKSEALKRISEMLDITKYVNSKN